MITKELMESLFPTDGLRTPKNLRRFNLVRERDKLISALNKFLPKYRINTWLRVCAFLSVCGYESDYFKTTKEYASGADYEGRRDLGNYLEGDGVRYPGSSIIQTTGRYNFWRVVCRFVKKLTGKDFSKDAVRYRNFGEYLRSHEYNLLLEEADRLGVNFLAHPEKLREVENAVEAACIFWEENNLNRFADSKEIKQLNGVVNKGDKDKTALGWADRNLLYSKCLRRVPKDFAFAPQQLPIVTTVLGNSSYTTQTNDQNTEGIVPTPTEDGGFTLPDLNMDTARQHLNDGVEIVKRPGVKKVVLMVIYKIFAYIGLVWEFGLSGKVALILGGILIVSSIIYTVYHYRAQIKAGYQKLKAAVLKSVSKPNA